MKIQILSDLHYEIADFNPIMTDANVVVLAGDIDKGLNALTRTGSYEAHQHVVYVPGNHEYYRGTRSELIKQMKAEPHSSRIHVLDNNEIIIGDVRFLGCTLWTDFLLFGEAERPWAMREGSRYLNDFNLIAESVHPGKPSKPFTPERSVELFNESVKWLEARLDEGFDGKTVVVTHHLPSMLSVADRYKESKLSACFASNLDHLFGRMDLWIHGHTHDSIDYVSNGTRVVCNPRGYERRGQEPENLDFDPKFTVEI